MPVPVRLFPGGKQGNDMVYMPRAPEVDFLFSTGYIYCIHAAGAAILEVRAEEWGTAGAFAFRNLLCGKRELLRMKTGRAS